MDDTISRQAAITAIQNAYCDTEGGEDKCAVWKNVGLTNALHIMQDLPSVQPALDRTKISDLLEKIYSIQSVHLSVEGVIARKYYCKQLWMELFGSEDVPTWMI